MDWRLVLFQRGTWIPHLLLYISGQLFSLNHQRAKKVFKNKNRLIAFFLTKECTCGKECHRVRHKYDKFVPEFRSFFFPGNRMFTAVKTAQALYQIAPLCSIHSFCKAVTERKRNLLKCQRPSDRARPLNPFSSSFLQLFHAIHFLETLESVESDCQYLIDDAFSCLRLLFNESVCRPSAYGKWHVPAQAFFFDVTGKCFHRHYVIQLLKGSALDLHLHLPPEVHLTRSHVTCIPLWLRLYSNK